MRNRKTSSAPGTGASIMKSVAAEKMPDHFFADSIEVKNLYLNERLGSLQYALNTCNLLEHPLKIYELCCKISLTKKMLRDIRS